MSPRQVRSGKNESCVFMKFVPTPLISIGIFSGRPDVAANMPPMVQVLYFREFPPFSSPSVWEPEKFSFSSEIFVSSGI